MRIALLPACLAFVASSAAAQIDLSGCTHRASVHSIDCQVDHVYVCEGRGKVTGATVSFQDGKVFYEALDDAKGYILEEHVSYDDGIEQSVELPWARRYESRLKADGRAVEIAGQRFSVTFNGQTYIRTEQSETTFEAFNEKVLRFSGVPYVYRSVSESILDGTVFARNVRETRGHYVAEHDIYLYQTYASRPDGEPLVREDVRAVAVLFPGDEGFASTKTLLACGKVS